MSAIYGEGTGTFVIFDTAHVLEPYERSLLEFLLFPVRLVRDSVHFNTATIPFMYR